MPTLTNFSIFEDTGEFPDRRRDGAALNHTDLSYIAAAPCLASKKSMIGQ
jgi:hypothetical protein